MELHQMDIASRCLGQTLTPQEKSNLEIGMRKRRATESLSDIKFWGRIHGQAQDYVIAVATVPGKGYPKKKFYFCTNTSPELQQFPEQTLNKKDVVSKLTSRLKGDPSFLLSGNGEEGEDGGNNVGNSVTELDRLAYIVDEIDGVISVAPREAMIVSPSRQLILNPSFLGLPWEQALHLGNYFHLREAETPERSTILQENDGLLRAESALDPLTQDLDGTWSLVLDNSSHIVTLRNFVYPGGMGFHEPESAVFGSVYFGDGRKNPDLAFTI